MTDAQRKTLEEWGRLATADFGGDLGGAVAAALAEIDRLRADLAGLVPLADLAADNADWIAYGAAREREGCCRWIEIELADCQRRADSHGSGDLWVAYQTEAASLQSALDAFRDFGPLAPPAPWERLASRVAALEAALRDVLDHYYRPDRVKAARKTLEESP